ncbi:hypothetical protein D3C87_1160760 [compost metagenome]
MEQKSLVVDLGDEDWKEFYSAPATATLKVEEPDKDHNFVKLEIEVVNSAGKEKSLNLSLPLSDFDFRFFNKELTDPETEMLTRWLNQNLKVELLNEKLPKIKISWKVAA